LTQDSTDESPLERPDRLEQETGILPALQEEIDAA
jgi:hypothetical protein